jgi:hypothetical protein
MTVNLRNMDTVSHVMVQLGAIGPNGVQPFNPMWVQCRQNCPFQIPALPVSGDYIFTAMLFEGTTSQGVAYADEVQTSVYVWDLSEQEYRQEWLARHWWKIPIAILLVALLALFLFWVFGYRLLIALANSFESSVELLR